MLRTGSAYPAKNIIRPYWPFQLFWTFKLLNKIIWLKKKEPKWFESSINFVNLCVSPLKFLSFFYIEKIQLFSLFSYNYKFLVFFSYLFWKMFSYSSALPWTLYHWTPDLPAFNSQVWQLQVYKQHAWLLWVIYAFILLAQV